MRALVKVIAFLILIGAALAGGTLVGQAIKKDPGYVLFAYGNTTVEMSIWVALAILTVTAGIGYVTLRLMGRLLDSPEGIGRLWARLRGRSARDATQKGFMELRMGRYEAALKHLTSAAPRSDIAFINYLSAAEAANALGRGDQRDELLVKALETAPGSELAIGLAEARMQFDNGQLEACAETLRALRKQKAKDKELIMLSCQVCQALGHIEELIDLLPLAKKFQVMPAEDCAALELEAYSLSLKQAVEDAEPASKPNQWPLALKTTWTAIPKTLQLDAGLIKILIQGLISANATELAVKELEKALKKAPEAELFVLYAQIQSEDPSARLVFLDKLGKGLQHRAPLNFARGQLAWRQGDLPMAEQAFEASLADQPNGQTYESLAQVYREQGRHELELKTLQGLTEAVRDWPSMQSLPSSAESRSGS